jgi:hypothetical protein
VELLRRAAMAVCNTEKYAQRGEIGELVLHVVMRQCCRTDPAISKIYFKDAANDTVKGFDAVHVLQFESSLELWLGEAKFYDSIQRAIRDVVAELRRHTEHDYLRSEFAAIQGKIDPLWPHAERLRKLIDPQTSLDEVFDALCIPVLLTYDSQTVQAFSRWSEEYRTAFEREVTKAYSDFCERVAPLELRVHLFLVPLHSKRELVEAFHRSLQACQNI